MSTVPERRKNLPLRELVAKAYLIIEPFFDPANAWNGQTESVQAVLGCVDRGAVG